MLDDHWVSRRHAILHAIAGRLFCVDLASRTRLHFEPQDEIRSRGWLAPGQGLRVGRFRLVLPITGDSDLPTPIDWDPTESEAPASLQEAPLPAVQMEMPIRSGRGKTFWRMNGQIALVGRADACQLVLSHENISRIHAALVRTPAGLWVVDLRARHGILVNGIRVVWAWLDEGDLVKLGPFGFRVHYDTLPDKLRRLDVPLSAGSVNEASVIVPAAGNPQSRGSTGRSLAISAASPAEELAAATAKTFFELALRPQPTVWETSAEPSPRQMMMWQQQMQVMESFHNEMLLMVQMFATMHREHLRSMRDELDQVRRLTGELGELQKNLLNASSTGSLAPATYNSNFGPVSRGTLPPASNSNPRSERATPSPRELSNGYPPAQKLSEVQGRSKDGTKSDPDAPTAPQSQASEPNELALHGALCQRIAEIQNERQGYWKKILSAISK
jgi:pSer/pThr/pTyr-binding forkhead associated (FHA) protein